MVKSWQGIGEVKSSKKLWRINGISSQQQRHPSLYPVYVGLSSCSSDEAQDKLGSDQSRVLQQAEWSPMFDPPKDMN